MSLGGGMSLPRGGGGPSLGLKSNNNDTYYNKSIETNCSMGKTGIVHFCG